MLETCTSYSFSQLFSFQFICCVVSHIGKLQGSTPSILGVELLVAKWAHLVLFFLAVQDHKVTQFDLTT